MFYGLFVDSYDTQLTQAVFYLKISHFLTSIISIAINNGSPLNPETVPRYMQMFEERLRGGKVVDNLERF